MIEHPSNMQVLVFLQLLGTLSESGCDISTWMYCGDLRATLPVELYSYEEVKKDLVKFMPVDDAEMRNLVGDSKAKIYGAIILPSIQKFMEEHGISKASNGMICLHGVPRDKLPLKSIPPRYPRAKALTYEERIEIFIEILRDIPPQSPSMPRHKRPTHVILGEHDTLTNLLGTDVMQRILRFLPPVVRGFASLTCTSWRRTIGRSKNKTAKKVKSAHVAAKYGYINYLKEFHDSGFKFDEETCAQAAAGGKLACLRFLHTTGCPWDATTCENAAFGGHLDCLKYARVAGCDWNKATCNGAACAGHLEVLKYAHENGCRWDAMTCQLAAFNGQLECLKYAHESGCMWDGKTCSNAAAAGHLDCLKNGCKWDAYTCIFAAREGHLDCLKYAHLHGCKWGLFDDDERSACRSAAEGGHLDCLNLHLKEQIYAYENGCNWSGSDCGDAARGGHLECLKYPSTPTSFYPPPLSSTALLCFSALRAFRIYPLTTIYAHQNGCRLDEVVCLNAVSIGDLACLKYAHENGALWDEEVSAEAANKGQLDCLRYVHENGCPWDYSTCMNAAANGSLDCLKYARENGCDWSAATFNFAVENDNEECWRYAVMNGCAVGKRSMWLVNEYVEEELKMQEEEDGRKRKRKDRKKGRQQEYLI